MFLQHENDIQGSHFLPVKKFPSPVFLLFVLDLFTSSKNINLLYLSLQIEVIKSSSMEITEIIEFIVNYGLVNL